MELQIALGSTLIVILDSPGQTQAVLAKALEIADDLNDLDAQTRALAALSSAHIYHQDYGRARTALERLRQVAEQIGEPGIVAVADRRIGTRLLTVGRLCKSQQCFK